MAASASEQRTRFLQAVADKFGDDGKAYYMAGNSQTLVTPYDEESETRVLVTMLQGTVVFTREGCWLAGGLLHLQRIVD